MWFWRFDSFSTLSSQGTWRLRSFPKNVMANDCESYVLVSISYGALTSPGYFDDVGRTGNSRATNPRSLFLLRFVYILQSFPLYPRSPGCKINEENPHERAFNNGKTPQFFSTLVCIYVYKRYGTGKLYSTVNCVMLWYFAEQLRLYTLNQVLRKWILLFLRLKNGKAQIPQ